MTGLEQTFYIMAIVYMAVAFLILLALIAAVLAIKAKVNAIHRNIEEKINPAMKVARVGEEIFDKAKKVVNRR